MVYGLGNPNNFDNWPINLRGPEKSQPIESGLYLQSPPPFTQNVRKRFGEIVEGEILPNNRKSNSNQQETDNADDSKNRLAYTSAYANSVRAKINEDVVARVNMNNLDQPITQKQLLALNNKLDSIGDKLDQLLGSKTANTEQWNLKKASLQDNSYGNSEIDVA